jgi:hypothetical protein
MCTRMGIISILHVRQDFFINIKHITKRKSEIPHIKRIILQHNILPWLWKTNKQTIKHNYKKVSRQLFVISIPNTTYNLPSSCRSVAGKSTQLIYIAGYQHQNDVILTHSFLSFLQWSSELPEKRKSIHIKLIQSVYIRSSCFSFDFSFIYQTLFN